MTCFKPFRSAVCAAFCLLGVNTAQAALNDRGGGLIYDSDLNITWLADANYAQTQYTTSGGTLGDADGRMMWLDANSWAANLVYHDSVRNVDYSDWRLPAPLNQDGTGPCEGFSCTSSEMGHMFFNNLGATAFNSVLSGTNTANLALFTNLQSYLYWSGTVYAPNPADLAWYFGTDVGDQSIHYQSVELYAWAVRPGDVTAAIPEPETYAMLLAGLGLLGFAARRRKLKEAAAA